MRRGDGVLGTVDLRRRARRPRWRPDHPSSCSDRRCTLAPRERGSFAWASGVVEAHGAWPGSPTLARAGPLPLAAVRRADADVASDLCQGTVYVAIIRHARAARADLVVLGRHGQRPVEDMVLGSTAERVICSRDLPALVVRLWAGPRGGSSRPS